MSDIVSISNPNIFNLPFDGKPIRAFMHNDVLHVCGVDLTKALGYKRPSDPLLQIDSLDTVVCRVLDSQERQRSTTFINEAAFYELLFRSNLPEAKRFTRIVSGEILPTIRRTGRYQNESVNSLVQDIADPWELMYSATFRKNVIPRTGMSAPEFYKFLYENLHPDGTYEKMKSRTISKRNRSWFRRDNYDIVTGKRAYLHQYYKDDGRDFNRYKQGQLSIIVQYLLSKPGNKQEFLSICETVFGTKAITAA